MHIPAIAFLASALFAVGSLYSIYSGGFGLAAILLLVGALFPLSLRVADQWEEAIVLRFGKHVATRKGGLFAILPLIDRVTSYVDTRVRTTGISAESALTKDTVTVNVDAVVFWQIHDTDRAVFQVENYYNSIVWAAQTSLREMIGMSDLSVLMSDRRACDKVLLESLKQKITDWGIEVTSVEIRDVAIPKALQDAMSRVAQAGREREARVILADGEIAIAQKTLEAARIYEGSPGAMTLRQMNTLYEMNKNRGATVIVPSNMANAFSSSMVGGIAANAGMNVVSESDAVEGAG